MEHTPSQLMTRPYILCAAAVVVLFIPLLPLPALADLLPTVTPAEPPICPGSPGCMVESLAITRRLALGSYGEDVKRLQEYLLSRGYFPRRPTTTYFGPITQRAVQQFQCAALSLCSGDPASTGYGAVGPRTRAALREYRTALPY